VERGKGARRLVGAAALPGRRQEQAIAGGVERAGVLARAQQQPSGRGKARLAALRAAADCADALAAAGGRTTWESWHESWD
jgi:hypothetical protein